jgi:hypothetical protein
MDLNKIVFSLGLSVIYTLWNINFTNVNSFLGRYNEIVLSVCLSDNIQVGSAQFFYS